MMMSNGLGARDWQDIWLSFAAYSPVVAVPFDTRFRHKPREVQDDAAVEMSQPSSS